MNLDFAKETSVGKWLGNKHWKNIAYFADNQLIYNRKNRSRTVSLVLLALLWLLTGSVVQAAYQPCSLHKILRADGAEVYTLSNQFVAVVINATKGGGIVDIEYLPTRTKLNIAPVQTLSGKGSFEDRIYRNFPEGDKVVEETEWFGKYPYAAEIVKNDAEEVSLKVSCQGRSAGFNWLTVSKIYTLRRNETTLTVQHILQNGSDARQKAGLWVGTMVRATGIFFERNTYYNPAPDGVHEIAHPGKSATHGGDFVLDPPLNWKAILGKSSRTGLMALLELPYIYCLYDWYGDGYKSLSTFEWIVRQQEIPPNGSFTTRYVLAPFGDFKRVDGVAGDRVVGGISLSKPALKPGDTAGVSVTLAAFSEQNLTLKVRLVGAGAAPDKKLILTQPVALAPGATVVCDGTFAVPNDGAYRIEAALYQGETLIGTIVRPVGFGTAAADTRIVPPNMAKVGEECVYPRTHLKMPGSDKLIYRNLMDASAKGVEGSAKDSALSEKERIRRLTLKSYPALDIISAISEGVVTPHVKWLKPLVSAKPKVLFMFESAHPEVDPAKRDIVEYIQRMDLDYGYLPLLKRITLRGRWNRTFADDLDPYTVFMLKECCSKYSAYVIRAMHFKGVQKEFTDLLLEGVRQGRGLVLIGCFDLPNEISAALTNEPVALPPNFYCLPDLDGNKAMNKRMGQICKLGKLGTGRLAVISTDKRLYSCVPKTCKGEAFPNWYGREIPYWEYMNIPVLKAIAWASSTEQKITMDGLEYVAPSFKARITSSSATPAVLEVTFRDEYNQVDGVKKYPLNLQSGRNEIVLDVPAGRGGFHVAECRLMNQKGGVFDCGAYAFSMPADCDIDAITLDKRIYRNGETVLAKVRLNRVPEGCTLIGEVEDTWNRRTLRLEQKLAAGQAETTISFKLEKPLTILQRLFVKVVRNDQVLVQKMAEFSTPFNYPPDDELMAYSWDFLSFKQWRDMGINSTIIDMPNVHSGLLKMLANLNLRPYGFHAVGNGRKLSHKGDRFYSGPDLIREPCFGDPVFLKNGRETILRAITTHDLAYYGMRDFHLVDELFMGPSFCFCPYCLSAFREYLKVQYGTLEALNKEWDTSFAGWEDVKPLSTREISEEKDNMVSWLDHRMFMNIVFANWVGASRDACRELVPAAKVGLSGTGNPGTTYNWWELMKRCEFMSNYGGIQNDLINAFKIPGTRNGAWTGGYVMTWERAEKYERSAPWFNLFAGSTAYCFWHGGVSGKNMLGDLQVTTNVKYVAEELKELKAGTAKLLLGAERMNDGIAMHYSQGSMFAAMGTIGAEFWNSSLDSWKYVMEDLGLSFRFLSYEQLEKTGIDRNKYSVFILPLSLSLSGKEIQNIRQFVEAGGILVADYAPGVYDGHGKRSANAELLEIFGVKRENSEIRPLGCAMKVREDAANKLRARTCTIRYGEMGLVPTTAQVFGDSGNPKAPAIFVNHFGKGKAILLNCLIGDYARVALGGVGGETSAIGRGDPAITTPIRELVGDIFSGCGVERKVALTTGDGRDFQPMVMTIRYRDGAAEYIGILKNDSSMEEIKPSEYVPVNVTFAAGGHLYDVREGKYLGKGSLVKTSIAPGRAKLYAVLPYQVKKIDVTPDVNCKAGEPVTIAIKLNATTNPPGRHVIHMEFIGPDQERRPYYAQNVKIENGQGEVRISTAINDMKGKWEVRVRDVATGVQGAARFTLK